MVGQLWAASSVPVRLDLGARERGGAELGKPPIHGDTVEGSLTAYYKRVSLHTFFNMFTSSGTIFRDGQSSALVSCRNPEQPPGAPRMLSNPERMHRDVRGYNKSTKNTKGTFGKHKY